MPKKHRIEFHEVSSPISEHVTKFGGQPVWFSEPQWPVNSANGRSHAIPLPDSSECNRTRPPCPASGGGSSRARGRVTRGALRVAGLIGQSPMGAAESLAVGLVAAFVGPVLTHRFRMRLLPYIGAQ